MRGTGEQARWNYSFRSLPKIPVDRARLRMTLTYTINSRLSVGLEANPLDKDYGPLVNWRALDETKSRPALIFGTSSDRIGTTGGRAFYGTLSKSLHDLTGLPIAPYVGMAFGQFDDELVELGGVNVRWAEGWSTTHIWDSENLHHTLDHAFEGGGRLGLVYVAQKGNDYLGVSFGGAL